MLPLSIAFVYMLKAVAAAEQHGVDGYSLLQFKRHTSKGSARIADLRKRDALFNTMYSKMVAWEIIAIIMAPITFILMVILSKLT